MTPALLFTRELPMALVTLGVTSTASIATTTSTMMVSISVKPARARPLWSRELFVMPPPKARRDPIPVQWRRVAIQRLTLSKEKTVTLLVSALRGDRGTLLVSAVTNRWRRVRLGTEDVEQPRKRSRILA